MFPRRKYAGIPFILLGLTLIVLGMGPGRSRVSLGTGVVFIAIGAALTARFRRREALAGSPLKSVERGDVA